MDSDLRRSMFRYYDQRAAEYEEAYVLGTGTASMKDPEVVQADVLEHAFPPGAFDSALVGFLVSHLTDDEERLLFGRLKTMLDTGGRFLILDSAWSPERARFNAKAERQERQLNDGARFEIYKRYVDRQDILDWSTKYGVATTIEHFGQAFVAVSGHVLA